MSNTIFAIHRDDINKIVDGETLNKYILLVDMKFYEGKDGGVIKLHYFNQKYNYEFTNIDGFFTIKGECEFSFFFPNSYGLILLMSYYNLRHNNNITSIEYNCLLKYKEFTKLMEQYENVDTKILSVGDKLYVYNDNSDVLCGLK